MARIGRSPDDALAAVQRIIARIAHIENRRIVENYLSERRAIGVKPGTLANDANALRGFCDILGEKDLEQVTKSDVIHFVNLADGERSWRALRTDSTATITKVRTKLSPTTLSIRKVILKSFFKWFRGTDEYPPEVKWLKTKPPAKDRLPTDALVTKDDLVALLQAHPALRDRAMIAVLYESGLRASEFCSLNVGSVQFDEYGAVIVLPKGAHGLKTGSRRIRLFESTVYLHAWFEAHPMKSDPTAALFYGESRRAPRTRLTPSGLWQFCVNAGERAGLKKHLHPHLFRHTSATERARLGWNEGMMRAYYGWARGSEMPSVYVHLAGLDYEKAEMERRGLTGARSSTSALTPLTCPVCKATNPINGTFCGACRAPMTPEAEAQIATQRLLDVKEEIARLVRRQLDASLNGSVGRSPMSRAEQPSSP